MRKYVTLLLIAILAFQSVLQVRATLTWSTQTVDKNGSVGLNSIALDSNNNPHIAYGAYEGGYYRNPHYVMYASWNGLEWIMENVTQGGGIIDLALDSNNNPHIVFNHASRVMYASLNATDWNTQIVDEGYSASFALDSDNNPHIAYINGEHALKYARWTETGWHIQTIDSSQIFHNTLSLELDSNNNPHILYGYDTTKSQPSLTAVKYAVYNSSGWSIQVVVSDAASGGFGNIALDSDGYPHFTYILPRIDRSSGHVQYTNLNTNLTYVSWNGSAWNTQTAASNIHWHGLAGYLALDLQDYPHIVYYNETSDGYSGVLKYSRWTGTAWDTQIVASTSLLNMGSIALDANGTPHIIYSENPAPTSMYIAYIKYATTTEPMQTPIPMPESFQTILIIAVFVASVVLVVVGLRLYSNKRRQ
jgi:hypothetical protein